MPQYELHAYCPQCKSFHDTSARIPLEQSFSIRTISSIYGSTKLHLPIVELVRSQEFRCPHTGQLFKQDSLERLVLIALGAAEKKNI